jgi:hypothetical protein
MGLNPTPPQFDHRYELSGRRRPAHDVLEMIVQDHLREKLRTLSVHVDASCVTGMSREQHAPRSDPALGPAPRPKDRRAAPAMANAQTWCRSAVDRASLDPVADLVVIRPDIEE